MNKKFILPAMMLAAAFASCTNDNEPSLDSRSVLGVNVSVNQMSRSMVRGTSLAEGEIISINVTETDGSAYDDKGTGYLNVGYKAAGTGSGQTWAPAVAATDVMLSGTQGVVYGYYPWTDGVDYQAIAVDVTDQIDWMWASDDYNVSDASPKVDLVFNHAQTAVNVQITRADNYTGAGVIADLSVTSKGFASAGTFSAITGEFDASTLSGADAAIAIAPQFTLTADDALTTDVTENVKENVYMLIPVEGETDDFTITATIDGKQYNVGVDMGDAFTGYVPGKIYKINVTLSNVGLAVNSVTVVNDWTDVPLTDGEMKPVVTP